MAFRSTSLKALAIALIGLALATGCSAPPGETGPSEEPNIGPGVPAGGKASFKPVADAKGGAASSAASKTPPKK